MLISWYDVDHDVMFELEWIEEKNMADLLEEVIRTQAHEATCLLSGENWSQHVPANLQV